MLTDIALDTVAMHHLSRSKTSHITSLVEQGLLRVVVDRGMAIVDEWKKTASEEVVNTIVAKWEGEGGFWRLTADVAIPKHLARVLRRMGFGDDTVDKVVLAVALHITNRVVVSMDSDFWDPADADSVGNDNACVCRHLRENAGLTVHTLTSLIEHIKKRHPNCIDESKAARKQKKR